MGHGTVTVNMLTKQNKGSPTWVQIKPHRQNNSTCGQRKKSEPRPKYLGKAGRNPKETLWSRHVIKAENSGEDLSNSHDWTPRILHNQLRVTLTHTPALPIHHERIYQELRREKEKERHTHTTDSEIEDKQKRKRKNPEEITECHNKLQTPIQCPSKLNRISHASALGAEVHHNRVKERERDREGWGSGERQTELEVLLASNRE